jgi:hypothetical protein
MRNSFFYVKVSKSNVIKQVNIITILTQEQVYSSSI